VYVALTLALECQVAQHAWRAALRTLHAWRARHAPPGSDEAAAPLLGDTDTARPGAAEDEGVRLEREAIQVGTCPGDRFRDRFEGRSPLQACWAPMCQSTAELVWNHTLH
jgi:hypothetical protein